MALPTAMLAELRLRAQERGVTITELVRQAVALERKLFGDPDIEVLVRRRDTGNETAIWVV